MVRYLISRKPGSETNLLGRVIKRARGIFIRNRKFARRAQRREWSVSLDRELIE